jgi:hypothetical protein
MEVLICGMPTTFCSKKQKNPFKKEAFDLKTSLELATIASRFKVQLLSLRFSHLPVIQKYNSSILRDPPIQALSATDCTLHLLHPFQPILLQLFNPDSQLSSCSATPSASPHLPPTLLDFAVSSTPCSPWFCSCSAHQRLSPSSHKQTNILSPHHVISDISNTSN